jgi:hypothetical protein
MITTETFPVERVITARITAEERVVAKGSRHCSTPAGGITDSSSPPDFHPTERLQIRVHQEHRIDRRGDRHRRQPPGVT